MVANNINKMLRNVFTPYLVFLLVGCATVKNTHTKMPDEIHIYKLPQLNSYIVGVKCEKLKTYRGVSKIVLTEKKEIYELYSLFEDPNHFIEDTSFHEIDARILIEYVTEGQIIKSICWSNTRQIQKDGGVFLYKKEVEDYLLSKKLIFKLKE